MCFTLLRPLSVLEHFCSDVGLTEKKIRTYFTRSSSSALLSSSDGCWLRAAWNQEFVRDLFALSRERLSLIEPVSLQLNLFHRSRDPTSCSCLICSSSWCTLSHAPFFSSFRAFLSDSILSLFHFTRQLPKNRRNSISRLTQEKYETEITRLESSSLPLLLLLLLALLSPCPVKLRPESLDSLLETGHFSLEVDDSESWTVHVNLFPRFENLFSRNLD